MGRYEDALLAAALADPRVVVMTADGSYVERAKD